MLGCLWPQLVALFRLLASRLINTHSNASSDSSLRLGVPMRRWACLLTAFVCGSPLFASSAVAQGYSP
jgi:hypothetical protein